MTEAFAIIGVAAVILILLLAWPCGECLADFIKSLRKGRP